MNDVDWRKWAAADLRETRKSERNEDQEEGTWEVCFRDLWDPGRSTLGYLEVHPLSMSILSIMSIIVYNPIMSIIVYNPILSIIAYIAIMSIIAYIPINALVFMRMKS